MAAAATCGWRGPVLVRCSPFICALVLVDTVFFTALTPLLPYYTRAAGLSKAGAGSWSPPTPFGTLVGRAAGRVCSPPGWETGGWCCWGWR